MEQRIVRLLSGDSYWPWHRQLPSSKPEWGSTQFVFGIDGLSDSGRSDDWVVVFEDVPRGWNRGHDPNRTIFFCGEPPTIKTYGRGFLRQFGTIVTTDPNSGHPNAIVSQTALPWHVGVDMTSDRTRPTLVYEDFIDSPPKTRLCSVITSNKVMTRDHERRFVFVEKLKSALGDQVDFFGRGTNEIGDKDEALRDYRFHIALENSAVDHYWTEKLSDAILRGCYPIYWGAPNIAAYFPTDAMTLIDIDDAGCAIGAIADVIASARDMECRAAMARARRELITRHNIFPLIDALIASSRLPASPPITLQSDSSQRLKMFTKVARRVRQALRHSR